MVIPTDEELLIARDTFRVIRDLPIPSKCGPGFLFRWSVYE